MDEEKSRELIEKGRDFIRTFNHAGDDDYTTDQDLKKPQPPLAKEAVSDTVITLPLSFERLDIDNDFLHVINSRASRRVYTEQKMSLNELSYLLWCSQGVKDIRGKSYATLRTVPCGGARHEFECYMAIRNVRGLEDGLYHYLPLRHAIEFLGERDDLKTFISASLDEQSWAAKANVVFYYSVVFYRAEWRYGIWAHAPILIDAGHITENVYLAAESIHLGGCAIAAVNHELANEAFGLDGIEETIFYAMSTGTVRKEDRDAEQEFYAFVKEEGL